MPYLNLNYRYLIYEDLNNSKSPEVRIPDITRDIQQVAVDHEASERPVVYTNEIKDILTTQRGTLWDATTEVAFSRPVAGEDKIRLTYTGTGTAAVFRTDRSIGGDATSQVTLTRVTNYVARIQNDGVGTAWTLGAVQVNDLIKFDKDVDGVANPFGAANKAREYLVQAVGADYIDFIDNGQAGEEAALPLGADFDKILRVNSQGPVKRGDTIQVEGSGINPSNHGKFEVLDVSGDFIEIVNPLALEETFLIGTNTIVIYEYLIGFVHLRASGPVKIRFNSQTEWIPLGRLGAEAIYISSTCAHKIQALNDNPDPITLSIQHARVTGQ